jgi:hypothetical protein
MFPCQQKKKGPARTQRSPKRNLRKLFCCPQVCMKVNTFQYLVLYSAYAAEREALDGFRRLEYFL